MSKSTTRSIAHLQRYINKTYDFPGLAATVQDFRHGAEIPTATVFLSVFWMFQLRLGSFNQLATELAGDLRKLVPSDCAPMASVDAIGYSLKRFDVVGLEEEFVKRNQMAKRNKVWAGGTLGGYIVAAMDGTEDFTSQKIHCPECLERDVEKVHRVGGQKVKVKVKEYYHRVVLCQIIGSKPALMIGAEAQAKGEGETIAGARLADKLVRQYGRKFFDVLVVDALYKGPFIRHVRGYGWHVVAHIKDEKRSQLINDADGLFRMRAPDQEGCERFSATHWVDYRIWDEEDFTSWPQAADRLRVLKIEEEEKQYDEETDTVTVLRKETQWLATTLTKREAKPLVVYRMGRCRWWIENNGNRDLKTFWHMAHNFVHADRALKALRLILLLAYNLFYLFLHRQDRSFRQGAVTALAVARELFKAYSRLPRPRRRRRRSAGSDSS